MNQPDIPPDRPRAASVPRPHRFVRGLASLYGIAAFIVALLLSIRLLPGNVLAGLKALAAEAIAGGLGAMVLPALLLAVTALLAASLLTRARYQYPGMVDPDSAGAARAQRRGLMLRFDPGFAARQGQALIVPLGAALVCLSAVLLWPGRGASTVAANADIEASFVFLLAFLSLVAERSVHAFPAPQLPEAPSLRRLLLLTTWLLLAAACVELGRGAGLGWVQWPALVLICLPCVVAIEYAVRALARLFLPTPAAAAAKAVSESIFATLITGGPRAPGGLLRTHLGLDFARSWALSFLSAALLPAILATAFLCWGLSGLKLIDLGQRGVYERFGAPVSVLGPGLHVLLPWPLGRLRPVEYGAIHSVAIGVDQAEAGMNESIGAEALPPVSLNRLWESAHAGQAEYLVASTSTGQQGFQTVSTEISVLYRVGLTDAAALQSVYTIAAPETLIREAASRLVLRYFTSRTLEAVLGARRENIANALRVALIRDLDAHRAGIDVVSVLIEEIHPPAGAAAAYHAVQAAEINASASISDETGRAKRAAGVAQQEAHQLITASAAQAAEILDAANTEAYQFTADRRDYAEAGRAFLLERSNRNLVRALARTPLTIVDHRLSAAAQAPLIDMRTIGVPSSATVAPVAGVAESATSSNNGAPTPAP